MTDGSSNNIEAAAANIKVGVTNLERQERD
jgi:hypothetical protein